MPFFSQFFFPSWITKVPNFGLFSQNTRNTAASRWEKPQALSDIKSLPGLLCHQGFMPSIPKRLWQKDTVFKTKSTPLHCRPPPPTLWYIFFSCHLQKFRQHDVIVNVVFWQPVPVHTPNAINSFLSDSKTRIPLGFVAVTTAARVDLTDLISKIPKRNAFCLHKACMECVNIWNDSIDTAGCYYGLLTLIERDILVF